MTVLPLPGASRRTLSLTPYFPEEADSAMPGKINTSSRFVSLYSTEWPDSVIIRLIRTDHGALGITPFCDSSRRRGVSRAVIWVSWGRMSLLGHLLLV